MFIEISIIILSILFFFICDLLMLYYVDTFAAYFPIQEHKSENGVGNTKSYKCFTLEFWRMRNLVMSIINALITGFSALYILLKEPNLTNDIILDSIASVYLVAFSIGYFIHDSYHMIVGDPSRSTKELLIHHFLALFGMFYVISTRTYLGFNMIGLLVELNSIFLHSRALLLMFKISRLSRIYITVATSNIITFVLFRLWVMYWQLDWMVVNFGSMLWAPAIIIYTSIPLMAIMNFILFLRILKSDLTQWFCNRSEPTNQSIQIIDYDSRKNGVIKTNGTNSHYLNDSSK